MAEVLVSTPELRVLGGPAQVSVDVDFGPTGDRGSIIFNGLGKPEDVSFPETPQVYDMYINLKTSDSEYRYMYQYVLEPGGLTWAKRVKLLPDMYSGNYTKLFTAGSAQINVPVEAIVSADQVASATAENFNIQFEIANSNPVASSLTVGALTVADGKRILPITINASELSGGTWTALDGTEKTVYLMITVV